MNVRTSVLFSVLSLIIGAPISLVGMSVARKSQEVVATCLSKLTRQQRNYTKGALSSLKMIYNNSHGSITVARGTNNVSIVTDRLPSSLITALYICGEKNQYGFLSNYNVLVSLTHLKQVQQSIQEGVHVCTTNKKKLVKLAAILMVPDEHTIGTPFLTNDEHSRLEYVTKELVDAYTIRWLEPLRSVLEDTAHRCGVEKDVTLLDMRRKDRQCGLSLNGNPSRSFYFEYKPGRIIKMLHKK